MGTSRQRQAPNREGASSGIGGATAVALAERGVDSVVTFNSHEAKVGVESSDTYVPSPSRLDSGDAAERRGNRYLNRFHKFSHGLTRSISTFVSLRSTILTKSEALAHEQSAGRSLASQDGMKPGAVFPGITGRAMGSID